MVGEIAGKHSPKAIYSSYFQTNTQTFMLAVLPAFLKSALLKSLLVCIEIEARGGGGGGGVVFFLWAYFVFHLHPLPLLLQPFPLKSCHTKLLKALSTIGNSFT